MVVVQDTSVLDYLLFEVVVCSVESVLGLEDYCLVVPDLLLCGLVLHHDGGVEDLHFVAVLVDGVDVGDTLLNGFPKLLCLHGLVNDCVL